MPDSRITGAYKHAGRFDSVRPDRDRGPADDSSGTASSSLVDLDTSDFAGVVCAVNVNGKGKGNGSNGGGGEPCETGIKKDPDSNSRGGCWTGGGRELWRTNGRMDGTVRVGGNDIDDPENSDEHSSMANVGSDPRYIVEYGGALFYSGYAGGGAGREVSEITANLG